MDHSGYGPNRIASPIRTYRVALGLTQEELGGLAGISRETVNQIERRKAAPRLSTARALAHVLGCEVEDIFPGLVSE